MIYFVTNRKITFDNRHDNITVIDEDEAVKLFSTIDDTIQYVGYDVETTGLDAWKEDVHLHTLGTLTDQFVFDNFSMKNMYYFFLYLKMKEIKLLGHNIKFDIKFLFTDTDILYTDVYDTMIAEQRLYMKSGLRFSLDALIERYLGYIPKSMDKNIRMEFPKYAYGKLDFKPKHILYAAADIAFLYAVKEKQDKAIEKYHMKFLIYDIEMPLISILARAELTGFRFNKEAWKANADKNKEERYKIEQDLDAFVLKYIEDYPEYSKYIDKSKFTNRPIEVLSLDDLAKLNNQLDLFGNPAGYEVYHGKTLKTPPKPKSHHFNYGSDAQIIELFGRLKQPLITSTNSVSIPKFNKKGKIDKTLISYKTGVDKLDLYLHLLPDSRMRGFIELLLKHRTLTTQITTFGYNFLDKVNPITNKIHTIYRQCAAVTGRFQSGDSKKESDKYNSQNIPRSPILRNCFMADEGYSIGTHDYSGAELIIMCSLSNDMKLYELGVINDDIHSPIAQLCWRKIYKYRATQLEKLSNITENLQKTIDKYLTLASNFIVSKKENKKIRDGFKPNTFGTFYGMYAKKAAESNHISIEEGAIIVDTIKEEFPVTIKMLESKSKFAEKYGFIIINNRTNSRAWFPYTIKKLKGHINPEEYFAQLNGEYNDARNICIQGTQADFLKEATVEIQKWIDDNGYDKEITMLSWIHDEIVDQHPDYLNGKSDEWKEWNANGNVLSVSLSTGENKTFLDFPALKGYIMEQVANRYLENNIEIKVDYDVLGHWTK